MLLQRLGGQTRNNWIIAHMSISASILKVVGHVVGKLISVKSIAGIIESILRIL
jgi:hypothetical protein